MAYAIFDTPAIHGIPSIKELAQGACSVPRQPLRRCCGRGLAPACRPRCTPCPCGAAGGAAAVDFEIPNSGATCRDVRFVRQYLAIGNPRSATDAALDASAGAGARPPLRRRAGLGGPADGGPSLSRCGRPGLFRPKRVERCRRRKERCPGRRPVRAPGSRLYSMNWKVHAWRRSLTSSGLRAIRGGKIRSTLRSSASSSPSTGPPGTTTWKVCGCALW